MIKSRLIATVQYGRFADFLRIMEETNEICRSRGWSQGTFYVPIAGIMNEITCEYDYPDLATYQEQQTAQASDPEFMKVIRSTAELVMQGSVRTELLEPAPHLA